MSGKSINFDNKKIKKKKKKKDFRIIKNKEISRNYQNNMEFYLGVQSLPKIENFVNITKKY